MPSLIKTGLTALALIALAGSANAAVPHKGTKNTALKDDRCEIPNRKLDRVRGCHENAGVRRAARRVQYAKRPPMTPPTTYVPNVTDDHTPERNKNEYIDMGESGRGGRDGGTGGEANGPR